MRGLNSRPAIVASYCLLCGRSSSFSKTCIHHSGPLPYHSCRPHFPGRQDLTFLIADPDRHLRAKHVWRFSSRRHGFSARPPLVRFPSPAEAIFGLRHERRGIASPLPLRVFVRHRKPLSVLSRLGLLTIILLKPSHIIHLPCADPRIASLVRFSSYWLRPVDLVADNRAGL